jgi:outer membrane protein
LKIPLKFFVVATIALWVSPVVQAQQIVGPSPITLQQAVRIALEKNPLRKAAVADTRVSRADVREARSFLMPRVTFSETATRGNDPVYVFGTRLRQQRFTADDFSLNKLNTPLPFGNFSMRFGGTWNLFDSFASWHGVTRAKQMNEAAGHELERTEQEIVFRVVNAYYGALLATKQLDLAEQTLKTSESILERSQSRFDAGLVVESDLLTAKVRMAARRQELIRAKNNLDLARAELSTALGLPMDTSFRPTETLKELALPMPVLQDVEKLALTNRPDLKRIES